MAELFKYLLICCCPLTNILGMLLVVYTHFHLVELKFKNFSLNHATVKSTESFKQYLLTYLGT